MSDIIDEEEKGQLQSIIDEKLGITTHSIKLDAKNDYWRTA